MQDILIADTSSLQDWRKIFKYWFEDLEHVVQLCAGKDAPYIHAEHGSTHQFGVSASKAGLGTIRELIGSRNGGDARLDLCMVSESTLDIVEAKWWEFDCGRSYPVKKIISSLGSACSDAASYKNIHPLFNSQEKTHRRSGVLFVTPYFQAEFDQATIEHLLHTISYNVEYELLAYSFPECARKLKYWERIYPGTIIIARTNDNMAIPVGHQLAPL